MRAAGRLRVRPRSFRPPVGQDSRGGRRRHAGRQASGEVQGSCFSPCMGWELAGARGRGAARCLLFTRRQAPAAAMPPCVWRWHTGLPAGRGPGKGQPAHPSIPSVRRSIARQQGGHGQRRRMHMHAHNTSPEAHNTSPEGNNTKKNPSLSPSCPSL